MRICLSIAITEMVVPLNETVELADDTCPNGEEITVVSANEPAVHRELYHWSEYTQVNINLINYNKPISQNNSNIRIIKI